MSVAMGLATPESFFKKTSSFSRQKPLQPRLESGLSTVRTRACALQPHRKKPRLGFFPVV